MTSTEAWVTEATVWDRVICAMGRIPEIIVCDNGFDSTEWRNFCKDGPSLTAPYNPRANLVERPHQFLKALFRINGVQHYFYEYIPVTGNGKRFLEFTEAREKIRKLKLGNKDATSTHTCMEKE